MSFNPGGVRALVLCAVAFAGYQANRVVKIDSLEQLAAYLNLNQTQDGNTRVALSGVYPSSQNALMQTPVTADAGGSTNSIVGSLVGFTSGGALSGSSQQSVGKTASSQRPVHSNGQTIAGTVDNLRIASWAINGFGPQQLRDPDLATILLDMISRFDVVALQQVRGSERDFLPSLVAMLNQSGRSYDYLAGPIQGQNPSLPPGTLSSDGEQLVIVYDTNRVVTDRSQLYTVADPENRLSHKPLVAWFRAAEANPQRAWTFSLVNMRVDLSRARHEVAEMPRLIAAIHGDGRGEDDVVIAGLLQADHHYLMGILGGANHWFATHDKSTDVYSKYQTSNLIVDRRTTTEAVQRGGVIDFLRIHNLSIARAEKVTPHLPVYAEFSPWEGGYR